MKINNVVVRHLACITSATRKKKKKQDDVSEMGRYNHLTPSLASLVCLSIRENRKNI